MRSMIYVIIGIVLLFFGLPTIAAGAAQGAFKGSSTSSTPYAAVVGDVVIGAALSVLGVFLLVYGVRRRRAENASASKPPK